MSAALSDLAAPWQLVQSALVWSACEKRDCGNQWVVATMGATCHTAGPTPRAGSRCTAWQVVQTPLAFSNIAAKAVRLLLDTQRPALVSWLAGCWPPGRCSSALDVTRLTGYRSTARLA